MPYSKELQTILNNDKEKRTKFHLIQDFLTYVNSFSDRYILKGGTALMICHQLTRFSEDIDLNSDDKETLPKLLQSYADKKHYTINKNKETKNNKTC